MAGNVSSVTSRSSDCTELAKKIWTVNPQSNNVYSAAYKYLIAGCDTRFMYNEVVPLYTNNVSVSKPGPRQIGIPLALFGARYRYPSGAAGAITSFKHLFELDGWELSGDLVLGVPVRVGHDTVFLSLKDFNAGKAEKLQKAAINAARQDSAVALSE